MQEQHFFVSIDGRTCDATGCGRGRFDALHPVGEIDLPVERTFCRLENIIIDQITEALAAEHLIPFDHYGQALSPENFKAQIRPFFRKYLGALAEQLGTCDGPLNGYRQIQATWTGPKDGFAKHRFQSDERGLLCQECGMVLDNDLHSVRLLV